MSILCFALIDTRKWLKSADSRNLHDFCFGANSETGYSRCCVTYPAFSEVWEDAKYIGFLRLPYIVELAFGFANIDEKYTNQKFVAGLLLFVICVAILIRKRNIPRIPWSTSSEFLQICVSTTSICLLLPRVEFISFVSTLQKLPCLTLSSLR